MAGIDGEKPLVEIDAVYLSEALEQARSINPQTFRDDELAWLKSHNFAAHEMLVDLFGRTIQRHKPEVAEPAYQGSLFGSYITRGLAEQGSFDYLDVVKRWERYSFERRLLRYPGEMAVAEQIQIFGNPTSKVVDTINNPVARTMFSVVIRNSLTEGDYETLPIRPQPTARDRRTQRRINKRP